MRFTACSAAQRSLELQRQHSGSTPASCSVHWYTRCVTRQAAGAKRRSALHKNSHGAGLKSSPSTSSLVPLRRHRKNRTAPPTPRTRPRITQIRPKTPPNTTSQHNAAASWVSLNYNISLLQSAARGGPPSHRRSAARRPRTGTRCARHRHRSGARRLPGTSIHRPRPRRQRSYRPPSTALAPRHRRGTPRLS